jgi:hypothetical protein
MNRFLRIVPLIAFGIAFVYVPLLFGQAKPQPMKISVSEIGRSVTLVGRLGVPLGVKMEIRGRWSMPAKTVKDYSPRFTVTEVNRQKLVNPIEFNIAQVTALTTEHDNALPDLKNRQQLDGQEWTLLAYETGKVQLTPDASRSVPYYTRPFTSEIVAVLITNRGRTKR